MSLKREQQGGLLRLTLARPEKRNAFDDAMIAELTAAYRGVDDGVKAVLLQAEGSHFSAGADLGWMQRMAGYSEAENLADARLLADLMRTIDLCPKPTIARVQGSAFAGAVGILACCDLVAAVPEAAFAISEVRIGLIPAVISPYLVRAMGVRQMRRFCLTAESFTAEQAKQMGLVHEVTPDLDGAIGKWLAALDAAMPQAVAATKDLLRSVDRPLDADIIEDTARRIAAQRVSPAGRAGIAAFLEKRK